MATGSRRSGVNDLLAVMYYLDDSDSSSSDDDDFELLLVHQVAFPPKPLRQGCIRLDSISDLDCELLFRFQKADLERLRVALAIPDVIRWGHGVKATGMESLLILLRRLSYPSRWCDLVPLFGRTETELSVIFNEIVDDVHKRFEHLLTSLDLVWFNPAAFAAAVASKGAPLQNCWGFIDGTARPIARPTRNQRIMFSGHKRVHCIKFQSVVAPNGLVAHMYGPIEGRRHDAFMLGASGLSQKLRQFNLPNGDPYVIYGDPAYGVSRNILAPFRGSQLSRQETDFNKAMSKVRVSVEWTFGKICQYFSYLDFKRSNKVLLHPVAKYYLVATLLTNCHTCLYGSFDDIIF